MRTIRNQYSAASDFGDEELCELVRSGHSEAFSELWERHHGEALGYARKLNSALAEDAVAEVMTATYEALCSGKGPDTSFRSYVLLCVRNRIYRFSARPTEDALPEEYQLPIESQPVPLETGEEIASVHAALDLLPERWREVLILSEVHGKSLAEVGALMGIESNAVSALLRRARAGLRRAWVSAHFSGAKLGHECSNVVEAFGEFRWGNPSLRQRSWFERHVLDCRDCSERHGVHAWLAQAVGLALLPLVWLGGWTLSKSGSAVSAVASKSPAAPGLPVVPLAPAALTVSSIAAVITISVVTLTTFEANEEPRETPSPVTTIVTETDPAAAAPAAAEQSAQTVPNTQAEVSEEIAAGGVSTIGSVQSVVVIADASPAPSEQGDAETLAPIESTTIAAPGWVERISGGSQPGVTLEFLLTNGSIVTGETDAQGNFSLDVPWSAEWPSFGYSLYRAY